MGWDTFKALRAKNFFQVFDSLSGACKATVTFVWVFLFHFIFRQIYFTSLAFTQLNYSVPFAWLSDTTHQSRLAFNEVSTEQLQSFAVANKGRLTVNSNITTTFLFKI